MPNLYLIKRGPRPEHHNAPYHAVIICDRKRMAEGEAGDTGDGATVWKKEGWKDNRQGWLLVRWRGFVIDFGHVVHSIPLPDGTRAGFWRDYEDELSVKDLLPGAIWWSDKPMPQWLEERGVIYPPDQFTQQSILDDLAQDGVSGFGRKIPAYWQQEEGQTAHDGVAAESMANFVRAIERTCQSVTNSTTIV